MTQVILNGESLGKIPEAHLEIFLARTYMTIVSRTATTINLEG